MKYVEPVTIVKTRTRIGSGGDYARIASSVHHPYRVQLNSRGPVTYQEATDHAPHV